MILQIVAGIFTWFGGLGAFIGACITLSNSIHSFVIPIFILLSLLAGEYVLSVVLYNRYLWVGFFTGLVLGMVLTCVLPILVLASICGNAKW